LQIWVEIDRQKKGLGGMISRFIGNDEITHKLTIALPIEPAEAGQKVLSLIDQLRG
jgi:sporulation-control protein